MSESQRPLIVIVTGPPGTGKTWLSKRLEQDCELPGLHRDDLKELLFDSLGVRDREWSRQLGRTSYELFFHMLRLLFRARSSSIVESNFDAELARTNLCNLVSESNFRVLQILCRTAPATLVERLRVRSLSGERHAGHADLDDIEQMTEHTVRAASSPLPLAGAVIDVDTTDFAAVDYPTLRAQVISAMTYGDTP